MYFIGALFSEEELSVIEEMAEFAVIVSILTAISTFFALITKIIAQKTSKNVPDELAHEKGTQNKGEACLCARENRGRICREKLIE